MPSSKKSQFSRRNFLTVSSSLVAAGLAGLRPSLSLAQTDETVTEARDIVYRTLGKTGIKLPIVSMGVMNADNAPSVIPAAYEAGIRHFDTAAGYASGRNEQMVGRVIEKMGVRDQVTIATKIYHRTSRKGTSTREVIKQLGDQLEGSLRRLRTDYVDILYIHSVQTPDVVKNEAIMEGLAILKEKSQVKFVGPATHTRMADNLDAAVETGFYDVFLTAINFTMADDTHLLRAIKNAADAGLGIIAMKTMAGGSHWPNPDSRRAYGSDTIAKATLKWVLRNENITTAIPGFNNFEHLAQDFSVASNLEYSPDEEKLLQDNRVQLGMGFCRQCQKCLATCPRGVDIPNLMRTHMYATQYGNLVQARATYDSIPKAKRIGRCTACSNCSAQCANTVDIDRRISELKATYA